MKIKSVFFIILLVVFISSCSKTKDPCRKVVCSNNEFCLDGVCECKTDFRRCLDKCIENLKCCGDVDCQVPSKCYDGICYDKCEDIACGKNQECSEGLCVCSQGFKLCNSICLSNESCCVNEDCPDGKKCLENICKGPCDIIKCGLNEFCEVGQCLCKPLHFKSGEGNCILEGSCNTNKDCNSTELCKNTVCEKDCYKLSKAEMSNCFRQRAIINRDVETCELVNINFRLDCYQDVAIAKIDRSICINKLPAVPPLNRLNLSKQNCFIEIAKSEMEYSYCNEVPQITFAEINDPDSFCKQMVLEQIELVTFDDLNECSSCDCKYRFVTRKKDASWCKYICDEDKSKCVSFFYNK